MGKTWAQRHTDANGVRLKCRSCHRRVINRPRSLCWACYYSVRDEFPRSNAGRRSMAGKEEQDKPQQPPGPPTRVSPGTFEKLLVLARRAAERRPLFVAGDADGGGVGLRLRCLKVGPMFRNYYVQVVLSWTEEDGTRRCAVPGNSQRLTGRTGGRKKNGDVEKGVAGRGGPATE